MTEASEEVSDSGEVGLVAGGTVHPNHSGLYLTLSRARRLDCSNSSMHLYSLAHIFSFITLNSSFHF